MIKFARNSFRGFFVITLWVLLLVFTIAGGMIGYGISYDGGGAFLGVIIGLFIWFIIYILGGGLIATFLNIDENIEKQNKLQKQLLLHFGVSETVINDILEPIIIEKTSIENDYYDQNDYSRQDDNSDLDDNLDQDEIK